MPGTEPAPARSLERPFRIAAIVVALGLVVAIFLAASGATGPGLFTIPQAVFGLGVAVLITAATLVLVLLRLGAILQELQDVREEQKVIQAQLKAADEKQHVMIIEGIGEKYATRLNQLGIISVRQLMAADAAIVAGRISARPEQVMGWQSMGHLMQIKGIGPQYAELLVRCGMRTVSDLARADPEALLATIERVEERREVALQKGEIGIGMTTRWVKAAGAHLAAATGGRPNPATAQRR